MTREPEPPGPLSFWDWVRSQVENESYWFQRIELAPGLVVPGWSDPRFDKLPYFGLPEQRRMRKGNDRSRRVRARRDRVERRRSGPSGPIPPPGSRRATGRIDRPMVLSRTSR